jgi:hypothetical protein
MAFSKKCLGFLEALATAHRLDISFCDSTGKVLRTAFAPQKMVKWIDPPRGLGEL